MATGAAKRYAQAAFDIAKRQGRLDQWEHDLKALVDVVLSPEMTTFFENPAVPNEAKQRVIEDVLPDPDQLYARNFALLLLERGRLLELPEVARVFHVLVLEDRGIAIAEVTTAVELSREEQQVVEQQLAQLIGKEIVLRPQVDPAIIGGIVVRVGDHLIDGSVRSQLTQLRRRLVNA